MYRTNTNPTVSAPVAHAGTPNAPRPSRYPSRDFGTGYGRSSGYAAARRYATGTPPVARFRLV